MMRTRLDRLRDLGLLLLTTISAVISAILVAGKLKFAQMFEIALEGRTLRYAIAFGAAALVFGLAYVLLPPPERPAPDRPRG
jgi:hypothetical protein